MFQNCVKIDVKHQKENNLNIFLCILFHRVFSTLFFLLSLLFCSVISYQWQFLQYLGTVFQDKVIISKTYWMESCSPFSSTYVSISFHLFLFFVFCLPLYILNPNFKLFILKWSYDINIQYPLKFFSNLFFYYLFCFTFHLFSFFSRSLFSLYLL